MTCSIYCNAHNDCAKFDSIFSTLIHLIVLFIHLICNFFTFGKEFQVFRYNLSILCNEQVRRTCTHFCFTYQEKTHIVTIVVIFIIQLSSYQRIPRCFSQ